MKTTLPKLSEMLGLPACLTDAERGTAIAVYNHSGESAALKSAHNMIGKRLTAQAEVIRKLKEHLQMYIAHFDNDKESDEDVKEWLDDYWIPDTRILLEEPK